MPGYLTRQSIVRLGGHDFHIRSLSNLQQFADPTGEAERIGISSAMWSLFGQVWPSGRVLAEAMDHPDVEELYRRCIAVDDKISISTVYRTVKLFEDAGIIERHDFREGRARYEQVPESHHDHLINLRDGKVIEFTSEEIEKLQTEIARKLGYKLVDHRLELYCVPLDENTWDDDKT